MDQVEPTSSALSFTPRGFGDYATLADRYGSIVTVRQSSLASEPCVWIFAEQGPSADPNYKDPSPHLTVEQAKEIARGLLAWVADVESGAI